MSIARKPGMNSNSQMSTFMIMRLRVTGGMARSHEGVLLLSISYKSTEEPTAAKTGVFCILTTIKLQI